MLGKLAKKLRLLGYDSFYSSDISDDELIKIAKNENRILITKDFSLARHGIKEKITTIQITHDDEIEQILQINEKVNLGKCVISAAKSRCPMCNGKLRFIEKNDVSDIIPSGVLNHFNEFWLCKKCNKVYWEGTHIKNLQRFTTKLNERL